MLSKKGMLEKMLQSDQNPMAGTGMKDTPEYTGDLGDQPVPGGPGQSHPEDAKTILDAAQSDPVIAALARVLGLERMAGTGGRGGVPSPAATSTDMGSSGGGY